MPGHFTTLGAQRHLPAVAFDDQRVMGPANRNRVVIAIKARQRQGIGPGGDRSRRFKGRWRQRQHRGPVLNQQFGLGRGLATQPPLEIPGAASRQIRVELGEVPNPRGRNHKVEPRVFDQPLDHSLFIAACGSTKDSMSRLGFRGGPIGWQRRRPSQGRKLNTSHLGPLPSEGARELARRRVGGRRLMLGLCVPPESLLSLRDTEMGSRGLLPRRLLDSLSLFVGLFHFLRSCGHGGGVRLLRGISSAMSHFSCWRWELLPPLWKRDYSPTVTPRSTLR
jgi:hypothetical protein